MPAKIYRIETLKDEHRKWAFRLFEEEWGDSIVVSRGRVHDISFLAGFVALDGGRPVGLVTYHIDDEQCELVSINSLQPGVGIGSALVSAVRETASSTGCWRLWLITTNDNVSALRFYQQRGFTIAAFYKDAIEESRRLKLGIPEIGLDGIPLRDEIELEMLMSVEKRRAIQSLHHAQITIPVGEEAEARRFYCQLLGLVEIDKPDSLKDRGGFWLQVGHHEVHVGVEDGLNRQASKAHLAYKVSDIGTWRNFLEDHGLEIKESVPIPGKERFEIRDPFGNRIEFIQDLLTTRL